MSDLRNQIDSLCAAEKAELLDPVWESLEADALSLTEAQRAELDYRIARHEQSPSDVLPWEQVRAGLVPPRKCVQNFPRSPESGLSGRGSPGMSMSEIDSKGLVSM